MKLINNNWNTRNPLRCLFSENYSKIGTSPSTIFCVPTLNQIGSLRSQIICLVKWKDMKLVNDGCGSECFHWKWRLMIVVLSRLCSCVELSFVYSIWWPACRFGSGGIKAYPSGTFCVSRSSHETKIRSILLRRFPALPWLMVWYNLISWHQFATTSSCVCFCADWK